MTASAPATARPPLVPRPRHSARVAPLSFQQEMYWAAAQRRVVGYKVLASERYVANTFGAFRVAGSLAPASLQRALDEVVRRHHALRARFAIVDGQAVQTTSTAVQVPLETIDLTPLRAVAREEAAAAAAAQAALGGFDYAAGMLLRAHMIAVAADDTIVVLVVPHIVSDSVSVQVIIDEVLTLYCHFLHGRPSPLQEPSVQYADFALWQRQWAGGNVRELKDYVVRRFIGARPVTVTAGARATAPSDADAAQVGFRLPEPLAAAVYAISQARRVTPFVVLLSAFNLFLSRWGGLTDILLLAPFAGRPVNTHRVVGMFSNICPLRTDLSANPRGDELIEQTQQSVIDALRYRCVPYAVLSELADGRGDIRCEGGISINAVPDGGSVLPHGCAELLRARVSPYVVDVGRVAVRRMRGQLSFWIGFGESGAISGRLIYRVGAFEPEMMTEASRALVASIADLTGQPARRVFDGPGA